MAKQATNIVHWPGQTTAACDDHATQLQNLGGVLGFPVSISPCTDGSVCGNCLNEEVKHA